MVVIVGVIIAIVETLPLSGPDPPTGTNPPPDQYPPQGNPLQTGRDWEHARPLHCVGLHLLTEEELLEFSEEEALVEQEIQVMLDDQYILPDRGHDVLIIQPGNWSVFPTIKPNIIRSRS